MKLEKYEEARDLLQHLIADVFSIIELGFGKHMADKLWDDYMCGQEEEDCPDCCKDELRKQYEEIKLAVQAFAKMHGLE